MQVQQYNIDGINVDFEKVSEECGEHFIEFIRELSIECRRNQKVLSVDNYVPMGFNSHYELEEQGKVADYVCLLYTSVRGYIAYKNIQRSDRR